MKTHKFQTKELFSGTQRNLDTEEGMSENLFYWQTGGPIIIYADTAIIAF